MLSRRHSEKIMYFEYHFRLLSFVRTSLMRVGFLAEVQSSVWRTEKRKMMLRQQSINTELFRILIKLFQSIEGTTATGYWRWLLQATLSSSLRKSFRRHCKEPSWHPLNEFPINSTSSPLHGQPYVIEVAVLFFARWKSVLFFSWSLRQPR